MGRLIPAGTGYKYYRDVELAEDLKPVEAEAPQEEEAPVPEV